jgi:hypothetical protein
MGCPHPDYTHTQSYNTLNYVKHSVHKPAKLHPSQTTPIFPPLAPHTSFSPPPLLPHLKVGPLRGLHLAGPGDEGLDFIERPVHGFGGVPGLEEGELCIHYVALGIHAIHDDL